MYGFLADVVVFLHLLYIAYVVVGQLAIMAAGTFKWEWGRNRWFRVSHLLMIGIVAFEAAAGYECPLTTWERDLRAMAGGTTADGAFLARVAHDIVFLGDLWDHAETINVTFIATFIVVLQGFLMYPPRFRTARTDEAPSTAEQPAAPHEHLAMA